MHTLPGESFYAFKFNDSEVDYENNIFSVTNKLKSSFETGDYYKKEKSE